MFGHVLVVGAGQMGGGIAQVVAGSGRRVSLYDAAPGAVDRGLGVFAPGSPSSKAAKRRFRSRSGRSMNIASD